MSPHAIPIDNSNRDLYHGTPRFPELWRSQSGHAQGPGKAGFGACREDTPLHDSHQHLGPLLVLVGYRVDIDGTIDPVSVLLRGKVINAELFAEEVTDAWAENIALEREEEGAMLQEAEAQDAEHDRWAV